MLLENIFQDESLSWFVQAIKSIQLNRYDGGTNVYVVLNTNVDIYQYDLEPTR